MNLIDIYSQPLQNRPPVVFKLTENRQQRRRMIAEARVAHSELMEHAVYRQSYTLGRLLSERLLSRDEVLQIFKAAETGATAAGSNRTLAGRIKDKGSDVIANARDMINGAKKWVRERPTYQAVDTEYNKAMTALGKLAADNPGEANKLTQAIYRYRAAAKEYPRATGLAKWAILALTGLATGGMGAAAAVAAIDAAIRDQDLVDIAAAGATGAASAAVVNGINDIISGDVATAAGSDPAIGGATPGYNADGYPIGMDLPDETGLVNPNIQLNPETGELYSPTGQGSTPAPSTASATTAAGGAPAATPDAQDYGANYDTTGLDQGPQGAGDTSQLAQNRGLAAPKDASGVPMQQTSFIDNLSAPDNRGLLTGRLQLGDGSFTDVTVAPAGGIQPRIPVGAEKIQAYIGDTPVTAYKIGSGWYVKNYAPAVQESMQWAKRVRVKTLPLNEMIDQKTTVMQWALNESTGRGMGNSVTLTRRAVRVVFENVGRYNRALCEYTGAPTKDFGHPTAYYAPGSAIPPGKKSWFGKGLDAVGRGVDKVGKWAGNVGHNMITKVTADKLANAWNRQGEPMDSDVLKNFLIRQGVPVDVVTDIWNKMSIPTSQGGYGVFYKAGGGTIQRGDAPGYGANVPAAATGTAPPATAGRLGGGKTTGAVAPAAPAAPAAAAKTYPGEDPKGPNYVGRREVARRQAARAAQAAKPTDAGVNSLSPYSKATYKGINPAAVGTVSGMSKAAPASKPTKVTTGGPTADERANLQKRLQAAAAAQGVAEAIVGKPRYSEPHQSGRGFYSAAEYMVRTNHQLGSHAYTAVTQVDGDNDRYYFIYQKGNKEPVFYATDMGQFEVHTDKLGNRISNAIMTAHREATDQDLEKYMSGDDESEWDQEQGVAEGRPNVGRHTGDKTVRVVRRGGKPIGEIGIDSEASPGQGQYYVKLYDGSVDLSGYDTAQEALEELRSTLAEDQDHAFKRGDRVYVRNQIGSDRVIRVVGDQVYLEKMGRAPMRDVSRVNPGLGQQIRTAGVDVARGLRDFVTGKD